MSTLSIKYENARIEIKRVEDVYASAEGVRANLQSAFDAIVRMVLNDSMWADEILEHIDPKFYVELKEMSSTYTSLKIERIKAVRNRYHCGLGEAKQFVEALTFEL